MKTDPWEWLRFQLRTADLLILAELLGMDVRGGPGTTRRKEWLAKRIWLSIKGGVDQVPTKQCPKCFGTGKTFPTLKTGQIYSGPLVACDLCKETGKVWIRSEG